MKVDFHTHILPGIDDGAQSGEEAVQMLSLLKEQGIAAAALTPHYYRDELTVSEFKELRAQCFEGLMTVYDKSAMPTLLLGCECAMWRGMSSVDLSPLCLENTNILMCEMPYTFSDYIPDELEELTASGYLPVIAHLDRYFKLYPRGKLDTVTCLDGLIFQINASSLSSLGVRMRVGKMAERGSAFVLGSDCHSLTFRPPVIKQRWFEKHSLKKHFMPSVTGNEELILTSLE